MRNSLTHLVTSIALSGGLAVWSAGSPAAQTEKKDQPASVAGKWTLTVNESPHGPMAMGLTLEQKGNKVTGTFASPHGNMAVHGAFVDGRLTLSTTEENADERITFDGRMKDDGTLAGYLSSQMGDMAWTAKRVKDNS
jgi:hypothetical protein